MWGHRKRKPSAKEPSPGAKWTGTLILDSLISRSVRNNACCISYPVDGICYSSPSRLRLTALSPLPRTALGGWWHSQKYCLLKPPHNPLGRAYIPIRRLFASLTETMVSSMKLQSSSGVLVTLCAHVQATSQDWLCQSVVTRHICLLHKIRNSSWDENSTWEFQSNVSWSNSGSMILLAAVSSHKQIRKGQHFGWVGVIVQVIFTSSNRNPCSGSSCTGNWRSWR